MKIKSQAKKLLGLDPNCLVPNCDNRAKVRGLCATCYQAVKTLVDSGRTTFEKLEASGRILPSRIDKAAERENWFLSK